MTGGPLTLLLACEPGQEYSLPESLLAGRFVVHKIPLSGIGAWIRAYDADAVLAFAACSSEELARLVALWKSVRPRAQFFLVLETAPTLRELVALMHAGAQDVIERAAAEMTQLLGAAEERVRTVRIRQMERLQARQSIHCVGLVGESPEMLKLCNEILRAASLNSPVLIAGETGAGKGLAAHALHALSPRKGKPFVTVDCGCLAPTLIESELYGVARGAFTGAVTDRSGLVEAAQEGTLFLDEIGELPLGLQPRLLRLLEEGEVRRLGSHRSRAVDVRAVSATSRDLESLIAAGQFRLDLYYRLNVLSIEIPPLRQRPQDIPLLARYFASRHTVHGQPVTVTDAAAAVLAEHSWPGNVRELKNCIEAAIASAGGSVIHVQHLPARWRPVASPHVVGAAPVNLKELERRAVRQALQMASHDKRKAARLLGISKTTLYRKLREMGGDQTSRPAPDSSYLM